jgi:hypothetical protein
MVALILILCLGIVLLWLHCIAVWFEPTVTDTYCYGNSSHYLCSVDCWVDGLVAAFTLANFM